MSSQLIDFFVSDKIIALKLGDERELSISLKHLRKSCPCAYCNGETDVFGNIYKGQNLILNDASFKMLKISLIGDYAIRFFWKDGHSGGIYTFDLLETLSEY